MKAQLIAYVRNIDFKKALREGLKLAVYFFGLVWAIVWALSIHTYMLLEAAEHSFKNR